MQCFIIQPLLSGIHIELQMSEDKMSVMFNNRVAWSAEQFAVRFAEVCVEILGTIRCRLITLLIRWFRLFVV